MSDTRVKCHPVLGILVGTDGHVMVPKSGTQPAHWTFGCKNAKGYMTVCIAGKRYRVHRVVAQTFIGEVPDGYEIDHISRVRHDNRLENIRIVSRSTNCRNRADNDRVDARNGTHKYEDDKQYRHEQHVRYYAENKEKERERQAHYKQSKRNTHRDVHFADGSHRWIPNEEALELLKIPKSQRFIKETRT